MKDKLVRWRGEGVEYPALGGKVVQQVRFVNDEDYTALTIDDDTLVSLRFKEGKHCFVGCPRTFWPQGRVHCELEGIEISPVMRRVPRK